MVKIAYDLIERVEWCSVDRDGRELRFAFSEGVNEDLSDDERFILEHVLVPAGYARRVRLPDDDEAEDEVRWGQDDEEDIEE